MVTNYFQDNILFGVKAFERLNTYVLENQFSNTFVLVDEHTEKYCQEIFKNSINFDFQTITIASGEKNKNLDTCMYIWSTLLLHNADRRSLCINLGGGMITDIGGFVASCFKRGISFVHIPTTLLGMVDAAIGGKNGVDFHQLKNQIGVINPPQYVIIYKFFLQTLPIEELISGYAEVLKHGLIDPFSKDYFPDCIAVKDIKAVNILHLIHKSIEIKSKIVEKDKEERNLRKVLNYGHTLGHAIESFCMRGKEITLLHGEAVAIGLVLETYISHRIYNFPKKELFVLKDFIKNHYKTVYFTVEEQDKIIELLKYDKKNYKDQINFILLKNIGKPVFDCQVENNLIKEAFLFYYKRD